MVCDKWFCKFRRHLERRRNLKRRKDNNFNGNYHNECHLGRIHGMQIITDEGSFP